jgi:hypothetical protein
MGGHEKPSADHVFLGLARQALSGRGTTRRGRHMTTGGGPVLQGLVTKVSNRTGQARPTSRVEGTTPAGRAVGRAARKVTTRSGGRAAVGRATTPDGAGSAPAAPTTTSGASKAPAKKAPAARSAAKNVPAKKAPAKKEPAKRSPVKKTSAKKTSAKKTSAKKTPAKKTSAARTPVKKAVRRTAPRAG